MGAFEDRLAAGYRKAERAPLRTAQETTPTTETGKRLVRWGVTNDGEHITTLPSLSSILAIEHEAAAQERERLGKVEYISVRDPDDEIVGYGYFHVERMDDDSVWVGFGPGPSVHLWLTYAKGKKVAMHVSDERPDDDPTDRDLPQETLAFWKREGAAQERRRLLEIHMADHDDATGWCRTCSLLTAKNGGGTR